MASAPEDDLAVRQRRERLDAVLDRVMLEAMALGYGAEDVQAAFTVRLAQWRERRARFTGEGKRRAAGPAGEIRFCGSNDLAVEMLASQIGISYPGTRLITVFGGSLAGITALECGEADIAGAHLLDEPTGEYNVPFVRRMMPNETVALVNLVQRVQGLMLAPGNPKHILGLEDLRRPDVRFINRQKGSGTRMLLDSRLLKLGIAPGKVAGYGQEETTHMAVASRIAEGQADAGLGAQSAAEAAGLAFVPLVRERYDLVALADGLKRPPLKWLAEMVASQAFRRLLAAMPGYDVSDTGKVRTVGPI